MRNHSHQEVLDIFRGELAAEGIIRHGDSIGTDDETLLCVSIVQARCSLTPHHRRFLRARKFDLKQAKKMVTDCQRWRWTVEGVGIDRLYDRIDPFDVRANFHFSRSHPTDCTLIASIQNVGMSSSTGQCCSTR